MKPSLFVDEAEAYGLLARAGLFPPRHGIEGGPLPFEAGEPVVVKGLGENVWHKSELGAVHFLPFEKQSVLKEFTGMRQRLESGGHRWIEGLVCEQIDLAGHPHLPSEAFVSLSRSEAGRTLLLGFGGLQADALAELATVVLHHLAQVQGKPVAVAVDSGPDYAAYRQAFRDAGLPVFDRVETALRGLRVLG